MLLSKLIIDIYPTMGLL